MLLFPPPLEYRLIYASLFPQARLAVCCLLSKSLKNLKELSSPWSLTATSPQLPPELGHQLLQDISSSQLPPASTDAWNKAPGKPESCSRLFFRIWRVLVSWCSKAYLVFSLFWLLVPDPVWHSTLLGAPVLLGNLGEQRAELAVTSLQLEPLPAAVPAEPAFPGSLPSPPCASRFSTAAAGSWATGTLISHLLQERWPHPQGVESGHFTA